MASVVEYKGLKAGYHCGYCASREGKTSCGECPAVRVAGTASRQALATSRRVPGGGVKAVGHPTPAFRAHPSLPSLPLPSRLGLPTSPSPLIAAPHRGGTEIAEGCPQSIWRGRRQSRRLPGLSGPRAPEWLRAVFGGARAALWGGGGGGGCGGLGGAEPAGAVAMASWSAPTFSLVEYFESQTVFQCGYCKNVACSVSNGERAGPAGVGSRQLRLWGVGGLGGDA